MEGVPDRYPHRDDPGRREAKGAPQGGAPRAPERGAVRSERRCLQFWLSHVRRDEAGLSRQRQEARSFARDSAFPRSGRSGPLALRRRCRLGSRGCRRLWGVHPTVNSEAPAEWDSAPGSRQKVFAQKVGEPDWHTHFPFHRVRNPLST